MGGAIERAEQLADRPDAFRPGQFENEANPAAHHETTAPEIWRATTGGVDTLVAGVGTGGTLTGTARYLKERREAPVRAVAVEPAESPLLSDGDPDDHGIQGIGPSFVPETLDTGLVDDVRTVGEVLAHRADVPGDRRNVPLDGADRPANLPQLGLGTLDTVLQGLALGAVVLVESGAHPSPTDAVVSEEKRPVRSFQRRNSPRGTTG
jgi:hypothetical protein